MNFLNKLERKFGKYAIPNLSKYLIVMYAVGAVLSCVPKVDIYLEYLALNPYLVFQGQIWRVLTFLIATPTTNLIFMILVILCYYNICRELEYYWGDFRFNLYILFGVIGTVLSSFILYFVTGSQYIYMDTFYLNMSIFLAYAACFPDEMFYFYGIIPIRAKWLGILDALYLAMLFFGGMLADKVSIAVAMINFLVFFFGTRNYHKYSPNQVKRRRTYIKEVRTSSAGTRHRCHICGRTELDDPNLEFRYCSKCDGNYEYCSEHLYTHTHIKND